MLFSQNQYNSNIISDDFNPSSRIVLYKGDAQDFIEKIPDNYVNLIMCSPPYNLGKEYEDKSDIEEYLGIHRKIIELFPRIIKDEGSICWQVGNYTENGEIFPLDILYYPIFKELGFFLRNRIIWRFGHGLHNSRRFSGRYETILWFTKSDTYTFNLDEVRVPSKYPGKLHSKGPKKGKPSGNPLGKNPSDVWDIIENDWDNQIWDIPNVKANHIEKTEHPCQFPIELAERCILALTDHNNVVFDPYSGVGSSYIAAIKNSRRIIGSEKEQKYVEIAKKRISEFQSGILPIRDLGKPIHQPKSSDKVAMVPQIWENDRNTIYYKQSLDNYPINEYQEYGS